MKERIKSKNDKTINPELDITNKVRYSIPCEPEFYTFKRDEVIFLHEDNKEMQKEINRFNHHHKRTTIVSDKV